VYCIGGGSGSGGSRSGSSGGSRSQVSEFHEIITSFNKRFYPTRNIKLGMSNYATLAMNYQTGETVMINKFNCLQISSKNKLFNKFAIAITLKDSKNKYLNTSGIKCKYNFDYITSIYCTSTNSFYIVKEYDYPFSLNEIVCLFKKGIICVDVELVFRNCIKELYNLHFNEIIHSNLTLNNILVNVCDCTIKFVDFGLVCKDGILYSNGGSLEYASPEIKSILKSGLNLVQVDTEQLKSCDIWSLGYILERILSLQGCISEKNTKILNRMLKESNDGRANIFEINALVGNAENWQTTSNCFF
jgi:serine/threonine protein kinase